MTDEAIPVTVEILDKEYIVSCLEDERDALLESARLLNDRLRQVRDAGKVLGTERMAVITALNLMNELNQHLRTTERRVHEHDTHIERLHDKLRTAIGGGLETETAANR